MSMLFDYQCKKHGRFETWGETGDTQFCPQCGCESYQLPGSKGVLLSFKDEGFPRAYRKWADDHERAARQPAKD